MQGQLDLQSGPVYITEIKMKYFVDYEMQSLSKILVSK